ncbi:MAG: hypothetical protein UR87_C0017G0002 [candidate division CPR3 bacterium GW2011_GWE2_35_7]|uniref:Uncharacterized protein n=1 Tax=candidate division CPR3 bacterium GW2011_GWF2_35_18 TaxID=1618350 RepID=A0A0G0EQ55_UNCC3|nr:MAG: hypothetical protein UR67_C0006G0039 [candidate division CPR3 bacterium GW2011_GWF2_35_18]KKP86525.1 MAG: hypothetical protein UR87_C0017G0002 [candidate division CPR3 bacterium GW2011_GWE2_35_7]
MNLAITSFSSNQILFIIVITLLLLVFMLTLFLGGFAFISSFLKNLNRKQKSLSLICVKIQIPKGNEIEIEKAEQMFAGLYGIYQRGFAGAFSAQAVISFEIVARNKKIEFYVLVQKDIYNLVEKQIHSAYSEAEIEQIEFPNIFNHPGKVFFSELRFSNQPYFPIKKYKDLPNDSLNQITSAMSKLQEDEAMILQILISPVSDSWRGRGKRYVASVNARSQQTDSQGNLVPKVSVDTSLTQGVEEKVAKVGFETVIRIVSVGSNTQIARSNIDNLIGAFEQFRLPSYNGFLRRRFIFNKKKFARDFIYRYFPISGKRMILNTEELATIFHFPNKKVETPHIDWLLSKKAASPGFLPLEGLYLGKSKFRGVETKVFQTLPDRRRHTYIIGQTGVGKSEFLKSLAVQDIKEGKGVAFIDPHGDAVEDILTKIPPERAEDVIYFDPGDTERPMGLNILEAKSEDQKHLIVNSFIALLYKLYDPGHTGIMGPRLERAIRNVMLTAMSEEGNSMVEVLRLLISPEFAKEKVALVKDPLVKQYWTEELAQTSDFHKSETLGYFVSKFDRFVTEKLMRNIIGQSYSAFDFREVMDQSKILLVNLSKGKIGEENSNFLGLILVPRLLVAAMSRSADTTEEERKDFFLYVDEFQNFATPDFATILSEARKFRLSLVVANQYIAQMDEHVKNAIFGNVGTTVAFRVGVNDGEFMQNRFDPVFNKTDLMNIPVGNVYIQMLINGAPSSPFSMAVDWQHIMNTPKNKEVADMIKQLSRLKYGRDRDVVEAEIRMRAKLE